MRKDTIYREDAIKALRKLGHEVVAIDKVCSLGVAQEFIDVIRDLPSADTFEVTKEALVEAIDNAETVVDIIEKFITADRSQGEWIDKGRNLWGCSNCGMVIYSESERDRNEFHKWCSRCGARMRPKLQGKSFDSIIIDESAMKGADDEM